MSKKNIHSNPLWLFSNGKNLSDTQKQDLQTLRLLASINLLEDRLIKELMMHGVITPRRNIDELLKLATKDEKGYYAFPSTTSEYLQEIGVPDIDVENLIEIVFQYYEMRKNESIDDNELQKIYYEEIFYLLLSDPAKMASWIIDATGPIFYKKNYYFLQPILNKAFSVLNEKGNSKDSVLNYQLGIILSWLAEIHQENIHVTRAYDAIKTAIELLASVEPESLPAKDKEFYRTYYAGAYFKKAEIDLRGYKLAEATESLQKAQEIHVLIETVRQLGIVAQAGGQFWLAERYYLRFKNWIVQQADAMNEENRKHHEHVYSYDSEFFLRELGFFKTSVQLGKKNIELIKDEAPDAWKGATYRSTGLTIAEMFRHDSVVEGCTIKEGINYLNTSVKIFKTIDEPRYISSVCLALAKLHLVTGNYKGAENELKKGLELMLAYEFPTSNTFPSFYRCYAALLRNSGNPEDAYTIYHNLYKNINQEQSLNSSLTNNLIHSLNNLEQTPDDLRNQLIRHKQQIDYLINPNIRTSSWKKNKKIDNKQIIETIRDSQISLIPFSDSTTDITEYYANFLPENWSLIEARTETKLFPCVRYFLRHDKKLVLLDASNQPIYEMMKANPGFSSHQDGQLYIRFFFDIVEGRHGKFQLLENLDSDIFWDYTATDEKKTAAHQKLKDNFQPPYFLYADIQDNVECWHFQSYLLFKTSLFKSKIELNTATGILRIYDDQLVVEDLPIVVSTNL